MLIPDFRTRSRRASKNIDQIQTNTRRTEEIRNIKNIPNFRTIQITDQQLQGANNDLEVAQAELDNMNLQKAIETKKRKLQRVKINC